MPPKFRIVRLEIITILVEGLNYFFQYRDQNLYSQTYLTTHTIVAAQKYCMDGYTIFAK